MKIDYKKFIEEAQSVANIKLEDIPEDSQEAYKILIANTQVINDRLITIINILYLLLLLVIIALGIYIFS